MTEVADPVFMGCSVTLGHQTTGVFYLPNLGGGAYTEHTHLPEFLIHCSEAELHPRAARLLGNTLRADYSTKLV